MLEPETRSYPRTITIPELKDLSFGLCKPVLIEGSTGKPAEGRFLIAPYHAWNFSNFRNYFPGMGH